MYNVPVCLPCVQYLWVLYAEVGGLEVKKVKETLDGLWQGAALRHGKDRLKYSIDVRLKNALCVSVCVCVGGGGRGVERGILVYRGSRNIQNFAEIKFS